MRKRKLKIFLTPTENSIVIQSLNHLRNALLRENRGHRLPGRTSAQSDVRPGKEDVKLHIAA